MTLRLQTRLQNTEILHKTVTHRLNYLQKDNIEEYTPQH